MNGEQSFFILNSIKLEVTHHCELRCVHCSSNADSRDSSMMPFKMAEDILMQAIEMGIKEVCFSGGEPLTWPEIGKAVSICSSQGVETEVYTSGNVDEAGVILGALKKSSCTKVIFSVYGAREESHERIALKRGSFGKMMSAVDEARLAGLDVEFHFVPLSTNYWELRDVINLAKSRGVRRVSILRFVPQGRGASCVALELRPDQNLELKRVIEESRNGAEVRVGSPYNFLLVNDSPKCGAGVDRLTILPDSTIYPCDAFKQVKAEKIVGTDCLSRLDKWSLRECWQGSPYLGAVREYLRTPFDQPCLGCDYLGRCLSGCVAQKYIANGTLEKAPDPMCLRMYM